MLTEQNDVLSIEVKHSEGRNDMDVTSVTFYNSLFEVNSPAILQKFSSAKSLSLDGVGLNRLVAISNCSTLEALSFAYNNLTKIAAGIFSECSQLTFLDLFSNSIDEVDDSAFEGLENLKKLRLAGNSISRINRQMFRTLNNLSHLFLHENKIRSIPEGAFNDLSQLTNLFLDGNEIIEVHPTSLHGLKSLKTLFAVNNNISSLHPDLFKDCENLDALFLDSNRLTTLNFVSAPHLTKLVVLSLEQNQVSAIDPQFLQHLTSLKYLSMEKNICVDKSFATLAENFAIEVFPHLQTCFDNYEALLPEVANICEFFHDPKIGYTCKLSDVSYDDFNASFTIIGDHLDGKSDADGVSFSPTLDSQEFHRKFLKSS